MSLLNKSFKDNSTGQTVTIDGINENIVTLNNGEKVATERMLDNSYYEEVVDPNSFFSKESSSLLGNIMDKVKNIKTDNMADDNTISNSISNSSSGFNPSTNESAVIQMSEEDERAELMRKYNVTEQPKTVSPEELLGETTVENNQPPVQQQVQAPIQQTQVPIQQVQVEDPIISMFKNVKRIVDFKFEFSIEEKIPRIDFIEMMEDSYNTSIVEYLADEFTNKLLNDPSIIKNLIKEKIESLVKQDDVVETKKTITRKPRAKKTTTETEAKKTTTTRKPTAKKPVAKKTTTTRKPTAKKTTTVRKTRTKKVEESSEDNK
jgi:hypothetical protein